MEKNTEQNTEQNIENSTEPYNHRKIQINSEMIYRKMGNQRVIVPVGHHIDNVRCIYTLNETAAFIFDGLKANLTLNELTQNLYEEYEFAEINEARSAIDGVIAELKQHQIIL